VGNPDIAKLFTEYSNEWIKEICKKTNQPLNFIFDNSIITDQKCFRENNIVNVKDQQWLVKQLITFLRSKEPNDNYLIWDYAIALFTARLLTANISIDKSLIELFENSTFVLDTNILMYLQLEKDIYNSSYKALESIFKKLNIKLIYFYITKQELYGATIHKIQEIKKIVHSDNDILKDIDDIHIQTALHRNCKTEEDFNTFFEDILNEPIKFYDSIDIELYDNREIMQIIEKGQNDIKLKRELGKEFIINKKKVKDDYKIIHDSGLLAGVYHINNSHKTWLLTRDNSLISYTSKNVKRDDLPIAISLESLINLFTINTDCIDIDPLDFAPLFANIVCSNLFPEKDAIHLEDLLRMVEIESQILDLKPETVKDIAQEVNRNRFQGLSDEKITLTIHRRFHKEKLELKKELKLKDEILEDETTKSNQILIHLNEYKRKIKEELSEKYNQKSKRKFIRSTIFYSSLLFLIFAFILISIGILIRFNPSENWLLIIISLIVNIISTALISLLTIFPKLKNKYNDEINENEKKIEKEINEITQQ